MLFDGSTLYRMTMNEGMTRYAERSVAICYSRPGNALKKDKKKASGKPKR